MSKLASITLAAALIACSSTQPGPLRAELSLDRTQARVVDTIGVNLKVTNVSLRTLTVTSPQMYGVCSHAFRVFDAEQREVRLPSAICTLLASVAYPAIELAPGQSVSVKDAWTPEFSRIDGQTPTAGVYRVVGVYAGDNRTVRSAPVDVTLAQ